MSGVPPWKAPSQPIGTIGILAIAFGVGVLGAYTLDWHGHSCACGNKWHHLGAFNGGDQEAHRCSRCGQVQWWKDGFPHVIRDIPRTPPRDPYAGMRSRFAQNGEAAPIGVALAPKKVSWP
jgi:hypothetical protein